MSSATRQGALNPPAAPKDNNWKGKLKMSAKIQLSDHFTYRKLFRFTLPSIVMMVFTSIYGVVDGYFISNYAGKTAFASVNLVMPFIMILGGMGFMIGTGGTALVSVVLGQKDHERANRYFSMMIYLTVIMGVDGIWLSNAFAEVFAFAISAIFLIAKRKKYHYMQPT